jgi:hypothetical protein
LRWEYHCVEGKDGGFAQVEGGVVREVANPAILLRLISAQRLEGISNGVRWAVHTRNTVWRTLGSSTKLKVTSILGTKIPKRMKIMSKEALATDENQARIRK